MRIGCIYTAYRKLYVGVIIWLNLKTLSVCRNAIMQYENRIRLQYGYTRIIRLTEADGEPNSQFTVIIHYGTRTVRSTGIAVLVSVRLSYMQVSTESILFLVLVYYTCSR